MLWHLSHRFDEPALALADRHYNRQRTKERGHHVLQLLPRDMPDPEPAVGSQARMFAA